MMRHVRQFVLKNPVQVGATLILTILMGTALYNGHHPLEILIMILFRVTY